MYQLQLAEGTDQINYQDTEFILVPDPMNRKRPLYMREDLFYRLTPALAQKFFKFIAPFNTPEKMTRVVARYQSRWQGLNEGDTGSSGGGEGTDWAAIIESAGDIIEGLGEIFGSSSGGSTPEDPGTFVNAAGWVYCNRLINGAITGFAVQPTYKGLIAFSNPGTVSLFFPKLPSVVPALPSIVPTAMLNKALQNPDKIVRIKPGTGAIGASTNEYEVLPLSAVGYDAAGNPTSGPPKPDPQDGGPGPGDDGENGDNDSGSFILKAAIPLALIAGLALIGMKAKK